MVVWTLLFKLYNIFFQSHDPPELKNLASNIGCRILPLTVNFTALSKDVTGILPQLLSVLLPANSQVGKKD